MFLKRVMETNKPKL